MMRSIALILLLCSAFFSAAQNVSTKSDGTPGDITIDDFEYCVGDITFNAPLCDGTRVCVVEFPDGTARAFRDGDPILVDDIGAITLAITIGTSGTQTLNVTIYPATGPSFNIYSCNSNRVQVDLTDTTFPVFEVDYGEGTVVTSGPGPVSPHTLPAANDHPITVRANYVNCVGNTKTVDVVPALPTRNIQLLSVTNTTAPAPGGIALDFETGPQHDNVLYQLTGIGGSAVAPTQPVFAIDQLSVNNLDTDNQYYCFKLDTTDPCAGTPPVSGNTLCSSVLNVTPQNSNQNLIQWQTSAAGGLSNFTINRTPVGIMPLQASNVRQLVCPSSYTYQLVSNYDIGTSISKPKTVNAISSLTPPPINTVSTIVQENSVQLQWLQNPGFTPLEYTIAKSPFFEAIGVSPTPQFTDPSYDPQANSCYQINYSDACGNSTNQTTSICPMDLDARQESDNSATLTWTPYAGWNGTSNVDHYTIERYNEAGGLISSTDVASSVTSYSDPENSSEGQTILYRIVAHPVDAALTPSVSNGVVVIRSNRIAFPSAFVPGSTITENSTFKAIAREEYNSKYELQVFNRWGELMFLTTDIQQGWDGTYKGNKMPEGTYVYIAKFVDTAGRTLKLSGNVVLLRK
jgi:gliding motility-associated-like protein